MVDFFPKAQMKPIGCVRLDEHPARYSDVRYGDTLETPGKPVGTITKIGRKFWTRSLEFGPLSYSVNASFPQDFQFVGTLADRKARIGNSVPPKFMENIARHIYHTFLNPADIQEVNHMPLDFIDKPINPSGPYKFNVITTFGGCGGSSLGYKWSGGKVLACVEWDDNAVATYQLNHIGTPVLHRDISTVTAEELLELTGLQVGELDIFDGSPPCFPGGFTVLTSCGKIPIDFCTAGMEVVTHTGKLRRISHMMKRNYQGQLYTIETKYGRKPFTCTPEHPIWARRRIEKIKDNRTRKNGTRYKAYSEPEWIAAKDLQINDVICEPHITGEPQLDIPKVISKYAMRQGSAYEFDMQLFEQECKIDWKTNEMAWLLGFYLAEGHVRGRNPTVEDKGPCRREVVYSVAEKEAADLVIKLSDAGLHAIVQKHSQGSSRVSVTSIDFWALCQTMGKYADGKYVPTAFFCMPLEWQEQFLDGYLTGDGCIVTNKKTHSQKRKATTISWDIALGIAKMIARVYGLVAAIEVLYPAGISQIQGRDVEIKEAYSVGYALPISDKVRPGFVDEQGAWIPIKNITINDTDGTDVYNMEVEEDHSYTVEGFGVHNCQGFSTAGKRQIDDPRNSLFKEYVRLLRGLQPKVFVMENVSGMVKGHMKHVFAIAMRELKASGYQVKCQLMNAMYFGVPQSRERVIFIGVRNDLGIEASHPMAQTQPITIREAFQGIEDTDGPELANWLKKVGRDLKSGSFSYDEIAPLFLKYKGTHGGAMSTKFLFWDRCSCTLAKSEISCTGLIHPDKQRYLNVTELKRLSSFPDVFEFIGKRSNAVERMGNAVPPMLMKAIASHIYQHILSKAQLLERVEVPRHA